MQFMLMIYEDERAYETVDEAEVWDKIVKAHEALAGQMEAAGVLRGGSGLKATSTATTVRRRDQKISIHDGPYAETREQLGGFYLIDVAGLDEAMAWAKQVPLLFDGSIEIRPAIVDSENADEAVGH